MILDVGNILFCTSQKQGVSFYWQRNGADLNVTICNLLTALPQLDCLSLILSILRDCSPPHSPLQPRPPAPVLSLALRDSNSSLAPNEPGRLSLVLRTLHQIPLVYRRCRCRCHCRREHVTDLCNPAATRTAAVAVDEEVECGVHGRVVREGKAEQLQFVLGDARLDRPPLVRLVVEEART